MNIQEADIMKNLLQKPFLNQRILAEESGHSLGVVNRSLKNLIDDGYLNTKVCLTKRAYDEFEKNRPRNAIILAAGYGMRMVPINVETPKAFLEVNGERLIERLIRQLNEVGINKVYVVVGFMKEQFEYLIDDFGVDLIVNTEYSSKNNLHSLRLAIDKISNSYIIPCDIWCEKNPFNRNELYSWYMVSDLIDEDSEVRVNRKCELVKTNMSGNTMTGISYLLENDAKILCENILKLDSNPSYYSNSWETALYQKDRMIIPARIVSSQTVIEINTYEQLRDLDEDSEHLKSGTIEVIANALKVGIKDIENIKVLKKGMSNRSFLFTCFGEKYIMRIPSKSTESIFDRNEEATVYSVISGFDISEELIYINPKNGYKITKYLNEARKCDINSISDLKKCMELLRKFHSLKLSVPHKFDIFAKIETYEKLRNGKPSVYRDYLKTKENVFSLKSYIDKYAETYCLTHIDAVPDNFIFYKENDKNENLRLIDWEYASMQDPHLDIAMFCIYSLYNKEQVDRLIDLYFEGNCRKEIRTKIYCYIAACGLLWSNWCEYEQSHGVEFGEYSIKQYRYAKEYYRLVEQSIF